MRLHHSFWSLPLLLRSQPASCGSIRYNRDRCRFGQICTSYGPSSETHSRQILAPFQNDTPTKSHDILWMHVANKLLNLQPVSIGGFSYVANWRETTLECEKQRRCFNQLNIFFWQVTVKLGIFSHGVGRLWRHKTFKYQPLPWRNSNLQKQLSLKSILTDKCTK